ncbi:hypothetical protein BT69DRAFT_1351632, partial [Atractiella rhizophila]
MFKANPKHSQPSFESYKLSLTPPLSSNSQRLPVPSTSLTSDDETELFSFKEARYHAAFNALSIAGAGDELAYVTEGKVVRIRWADGEEPAFFVHPLPTSSTTTSTSERAHALPLPPLDTISPSTSPTWLISSGTSLLHILSFSPSDTDANDAGTWKTIDLSRPFKLHASSSTHALVSFRLPGKEHSGEGSVKSRGYEVALVPLDEGLKGAEGEWRMWMAEDVPAFAFALPDGGGAAFIVGLRGRVMGGESVGDVKEDGDEDVMEVDGSVSQKKEEEEKAEYQWTQTESSLSLSIPLPPSYTSKPLITFTSTTLTIFPPLPPFPSTPVQLWSTILPTDSFYSISDRTLDLELAKPENSPERWISPFASPSLEREEDEDLSDRRARVEDMQRLFSSTSASASSGEGRAGRVARIDEEEDEGMEDGVEEEDVALYRLGEDGTVEGVDRALRVLSTPFGGTGPSLILKQGIDGLLFSLQLQQHPNGGPASRTKGRTTLGAEHICTFPALSYVLSSKRSKRYVFHSSRFVVCLEDGN